MWIERIAPELVVAKSTLLEIIRAEMLGRGFGIEACDALFSILPSSLARCECFLDRLTGLWRYELGEPHRVGGKLIWGVHMWPQVSVLVDVLECARHRLSSERLGGYLMLLADLRKHQDHLAEMYPMLRVDPSVDAEHEVAGLGVGNKTVDWAIANQCILFDVKRRLTDFFGQVENLQADLASAPEHDVSLLFRSVEGKFVGADPSERLQGAWIVTDIKQDANELKTAFDALDPTKVHFAILGDWLPDVTLLTRRQEDRSTLIDMLRLKEGTRFVFERRRPLAPG